MAESTIKNSLRLAEAARNAVEAGNYIDACKSYSSASEVCLEGLLELLNAHASALMSAEEFEQARKVADRAIKIDPSNSQSWFWKGAALLKLDHRKDAKVAFQKAAVSETDLVKKTNFMDWVNRCDEEPMEVIDATGQLEGSSLKANPEPSLEPRTSGVSQDKPGPTIRREWYQSAAYVNVEMYAKNVDKDQSKIILEEERIHIKLVRPGMDNYMFEAELFAPIIPSQSSWSVSRFKVEIKLKKARQGEVWRALDREAQVLSAQAQAGQESIRRRDQQEARQRGLTTFAESELQNYKEDDSAMSLFRTIYKDADDDMRRAMMKSYSESGGKVLSTNWDEVRKDKVTYKEED